MDIIANTELWGEKSMKLLKNDCDQKPNSILP